MELEEYKKHRWTLTKFKGELGYSCFDCNSEFISQEEYLRLRKLKKLSNN